MNSDKLNNNIEKGLKSSYQSISDFGINNAVVHWNLDSDHLSKITVDKKMGIISNTGALAIDTGEFTGRSPMDRFIVKDSISEDAVWWSDVNLAFDFNKFDDFSAPNFKYSKPKRNW